MSNAVAVIQHHLERLYELDPGLLANEFLVTDRRHLPTGHAAVDAPEEELLLGEEDGDLLLSLYLSESLLERLDADPPLDRLHAGNLADLCLAVEGVSHFLYVVWNALHSRQVTRLELELQAEIDKYILSRRLLQCQGQEGHEDALHHRLFRRIRFSARLGGEQLQRYRRANDYAASYCRHLRETYRDNGGEVRQLRELRRFYRLLHAQKLRHIRRHAN